MSQITKITDFELAEDLQDFVEHNQDVSFDDLDIENTIKNFDEGILIKVDKEIGSSIKIISVEEVTEQIVADL